MRRVDASRDPGRGGGGDVGRRRLVVGGGRAVGHCGEQRRATVALGNGEEPMLVAEDLGQHEVGAGAGARARSHRGAEAGRGRVAAVHGDQDGVRAPPGMPDVDAYGTELHAILDAERREFAGTHSEEGIARGVGRGTLDGESVVGPSGPPGGARVPV